MEPRSLRIDPTSLRRILQIGLPAGIQSAVFSVANIVIQSAINSLGTIVMAASSAAYNIEVFTYDILNSFSQACTTFVGQNFGAGNPQRCKKTLLLCLGEGICILGVAIAAILFWGKPLLSIFDSNPEVIETGYIRLMLVVSAHSFSLLYEVMAGYLRGLWNLSCACRHYNHMRMRNPVWMDSAHLPAESYLLDHYDRLSGQPCSHCAGYLLCPGLLPAGTKIHRDPEK